MEHVTKRYIELTQLVWMEYSDKPAPCRYIRSIEDFQDILRYHKGRVEWTEYLNKPSKPRFGFELYEIQGSRMTLINHNYDTSDCR